MDNTARRFYCLDSHDDPASASAESVPKLLVSALEQHGVPFQLHVHRIERVDPSLNLNSCDLDPSAITPHGSFRYEFLTTCADFHRAVRIATSLARQIELGRDGLSGMEDE